MRDTGVTSGAQTVRLPDGARVRLRAASESGQDDDALRRLYFSFSDTTRYMYFCAGVPANALWAERFVALGHRDGERSYVLVAEVDGAVIGFARFSQGLHAAPDDHTADHGLILTDAWQGRRLGGHVVCRLAAEAYARGVTTFTTVVLWENRRMLRLARRMFPDMRITYESGTCELTVDLTSWWASMAERPCA
jgi:acetyltransferase